MRAAFGGSDSAGLADTLVAQLGLTGLPFVNVKNGCATGGSALISAVNAIRSGMADVVLAVGFDKHPRGAFDPRPEDWGLGEEYGSDGLMVTTQFFGMKIRRYMHDHGITPQTLARVAEKAYRNGEPHPGGVAPQTGVRRGDPRLRHGQRPADPLHVLLPGSGRRRTRAVLARGRPHPGAARPSPCVRRPCAPGVRLVRGVQPVGRRGRADQRQSRRRGRRLRGGRDRPR